MSRTLLVLLATLISLPALAADLFKWTDAAGNINYTDRPPPADARNVERMKAGGNFIETEAIPYAARAASQKHPVTLYAFDNCGDPCNQGKALLDQRGVPYTLKNTEQDKIALQQLTGDNQIPVLVVGNQPPAKGWQESGWSTLLDLAGYPKRNPLSQFRPKPAMPPADAPAPVAPGPAAEPPKP